MRIFEREANLIREAAYQNFLLYFRRWSEVAPLYVGTDEEWDCPQAQRAYDRAMSQKNLADFLDPQSKYIFYVRYRNEQRTERHNNRTY